MGRPSSREPSRCLGLGSPSMLLQNVPMDPVALCVGHNHRFPCLSLLLGWVPLKRAFISVSLQQSQGWEGACLFRKYIWESTWRIMQRHEGQERWSLVLAAGKALWKVRLEWALEG